MPSIYLSSTYEDLQDYRRTLVEVLRKSGYEVIAMEDYVAADCRPVEQCFQDIDSADLYIGLFAFRYGYIPPSHHQNPNNLSITELEFQHAEKLHKPCLTFVVDDNTPWPRTFDDAYMQKDKGDRIKTLRHYLCTEKLAGTFSSPHELAAIALSAVTSHFDRLPILETSISQETKTTTKIAWNIDEKGSPYPGLMHFTRKYAPVFAGRELEVCEILDRMHLPDGQFIIVSGNSGVGKSSVIDAGVLPRIENGSLPGDRTCLCVRMLPSQGNHPFGALMGALHPYATRAGLRPEEIAEELSSSPENFAKYLKQIIFDGLDKDCLVLFLDQMEELFTIGDLEESNIFLQSLCNAFNECPLWVLATIRSDHLHHCHGNPNLLRILRGRGHYPLGRVEPHMLSDMIVKPARIAGLKVSKSLTQRIVNDTATEPGSLPLLAFVLNQLFEQRSDRQLSDAVYKNLGGISGAIAKHAETVESKLQKIRGRDALDSLPKLFQSLVILNLEGFPTRRRPLLSEFPEDMQELVNLLVQERLLHTEGEGNKASVSISHERLFDAWPSLKEYIAKNKKQLLDQTLLESRARKWLEMGKPLFSGLASRKEHNDFRQVSIHTSSTTEYLNASRRAYWLRLGAVSVMIFLSFGILTWLKKEELLDHLFLKAKAQFASIHIEPEMIEIPNGTYAFGHLPDAGKLNKSLITKVTIKKFAMSKYEITFQEYDRFAIATGRSRPASLTGERGRHPVVNVTWFDAEAYAKWLSKHTRKRYRLPTELEWEYAARSGGKNEIWAGTSDESQLVNYAVFSTNSKGGPEVVGKKRPNGLGLYDMSGNVWEWVQDCYSKIKANKCMQHVVRGGSWRNTQLSLRSTGRKRAIADVRDFNYGFRLVKDIH